MITEATTGRARGRPPKIHPEYYAFLKSLYSEITTRRGILNKFYEIHAFAVIKEIQDKEGDSGLEFLHDPTREHCNWGILRELGRLQTEEEIRDIALALCEAEKREHRTVKEWEFLLRHLRLKDEVYRDLISETVSDNGT